VEPNADAEFAKALEFHRRGQLAEAEQAYREILKIRPDHFDATHLLGVVLLQRGQFEAAAREIGRAIEMNPNVAAAHSNRGNALKELGRLEEALASYDKAIALQPDSAEVFSNRGNVLRKLNRIEEALASFERAIALKPDFAPAYINRADVLHEQGRLDEAIAYYERGLALNPNSAPANVNLGNALKTKGRLDEAVAFYRRALALQPRFVEAQIRLSEALLDLGNVEEAAQTAEAAVRFRYDHPYPHYAVGLVLARCHRDDLARQQLRYCLELDPKDSYGAHLVLASLGAEPIPARAPEALMLRLYGDRAHVWDKSHGHYRGYELVARAVARLRPGGDRLDILDAGCGTGHVGEMLTGLARRLDGVDLSPEMLEKAEARSLYTSLHRGDLVAFLAAHPASYDAVVSAATLIHFGDLRPVFVAARTSLRDKGIFVFTLFPNGDDPDNRDVAIAPLGGLGEGGCYVHGRGYVRALAKETGYSVALMETATHEYQEDGTPRPGLIVGLRRDAAG
jgi:predicted TPR repeat methyltransferase